MTATVTQAGLDALFSAPDVPLSAEDFRQRATRRVARGVELAGDAYEFSEHSDGFTYGTNRWRFVLKELSLGFADIAGVQTLSSGGMRVTLLPVGDGRAVMVYPLRFADDAHTSVQHLKVRPSRLRRLLFTGGSAGAKWYQPMLTGFEAQQPPVPTGDGDVEAAYEDAVAEEIEAAIAVLSQLPRTIIIGYASNPGSGLLQLVIGEASMSTDGTMTFCWLEQLPVGEDTPALYSVSAPDQESFDAAPEPEYDVLLLREDLPGDADLDD